MFNFMKPYSAVRKGWGFWSAYLIKFEEDTIYIVDDKLTANSIVGLLNGAYNLGRSHEIVNREEVR